VKHYCSYVVYRLITLLLTSPPFFQSSSSITLNQRLRDAFMTPLFWDRGFKLHGLIPTVWISHIISRTHLSGRQPRKSVLIKSICQVLSRSCSKKTMNTAMGFNFVCQSSPEWTLNLPGEITLEICKSYINVVGLQTFHRKEQWYAYPPPPLFKTRTSKS